MVFPQKSITGEGQGKMRMDCPYHSRSKGKEGQEFSAVNAFQKRKCAWVEEGAITIRRFLETGNFELSEEYKGVYEVKK